MAHARSCLKKDHSFCWLCDFKETLSSLFYLSAYYANSFEISSLCFYYNLFNCASVQFGVHNDCYKIPENLAADHLKLVRSKFVISVR